MINYCEETIAILSMGSYLNRYAFGNVQNELDIGIVVVISPSWHRHVMIGHFDVLCEPKARTKENLLFSPNHLAAVTYTVFHAGYLCTV